MIFKEKKKKEKKWFQLVHFQQGNSGKSFVEKLKKGINFSGSNMQYYTVFTSVYLEWNITGD